jgi:hypothetical protein
MTRINYPASSPYAATPQTSWYISNYTHRPIPSAGDDKTLTINKRYQFRPDILSNDQYGTPAYWWVFAVRNRNIIVDPIWDLDIGRTIIIPSLSTIKKAIGS